MGKFYLENKHLWFKHLMEKSHREKMEQGGCLAGLPQETQELRFFYNLDGTPPRMLQLYEAYKDLIAVKGGNGYVGDLDAESSAVVRVFFTAFPEVGGVVVASYVRPEEFSGAHILRLGIK